ncbi:pyroglutamyl-peptidase 1-like isoform X2 [Eriocheir sinensis]|uniref:pyroglutamyl-peptidase 1-like isoform X2 n=1 Tax=Eriocheir sinensis TaxID=95602 RepID=UPI0021C6907F|nr:pyroglutamyl-peptidase 1-like isoform X2 [Eriocheir sinensis]
MEDVHGAEDLRPVIYVTGFGPFSGHAINASQLAVELLPREDIEEKLGVRLITEIVEVEYEYVKKTIPQRWKKYMPKLTVHVGVSNLAETLTLEQLAHNTGYEKEDNCGCVPIGGLCHSDGTDIIQSSIQMDMISSTLNKATCLKLPCAKSTDPGRFLCDFTYYLSLKEDKSRSAFIHVPTLQKFTAEEISSALAAAIKEMYLQRVAKRCTETQDSMTSR